MLPYRRMCESLYRNEQFGNMRADGIPSLPSIPSINAYDSLASKIARAKAWYSNRIYDPESYTPSSNNFYPSPDANRYSSIGMDSPIYMKKRLADKDDEPYRVVPAVWKLKKTIFGKKYWEGPPLKDLSKMIYSQLHESLNDPRLVLGCWSLFIKPKGEKTYDGQDLYEQYEIFEGPVLPNGRIPYRSSRRDELSRLENLKKVNPTINPTIDTSIRLTLEFATMRARSLRGGAITRRNKKKMNTKLLRKYKTRRA